MDRVAASFAKMGMMQHLQAELTNVAAGSVSISAPITSVVTQQYGFAHAGLSFALGDTAAGYAALTMMDPGKEVMTVEMKINLIAPGDGIRLIATGSVVKAGRRLVVTRSVVETEYADGARKEVAILQGTMIPV